MREVAQTVLRSYNETQTGFLRRSAACYSAKWRLFFALRSGFAEQGAPLRYEARAASAISEDAYLVGPR
jgi:hypothetical protein